MGGGNGALLMALLDRYPELHGVLVDLPAAIEAARRSLVGTDLARRCELAPGSFFDPLPAGAGGYLLSAIVHNWPDDAATRVLRRCAEAVRPTGRVLVVERMGPHGTVVDTARDLRMLAYFGARERSLDALEQLARAAGLAVVAVHPAGPSSVVELEAVRTPPA